MKALALILLASIANAQSYYDKESNRVGASTYYYKSGSTQTADTTPLFLASHTVSTAKTFYPTAITASVIFSAKVPPTAELMGAVSIDLSTPSLAGGFMTPIFLGSMTAFSGFAGILSFPIDGVAISSGSFLRIRAHASTTTAVTWGGTIRGYER